MAESVAAGRRLGVHFYRECVWAGASPDVDFDGDRHRTHRYGTSGRVYVDVHPNGGTYCDCDCAAFGYAYIYIDCHVYGAAYCHAYGDVYVDADIYAHRNARAYLHVHGCAGAAGDANAGSNRDSDASACAGRRGLARRVFRQPRSTG